MDASTSPYQTKTQAARTLGCHHKTVLRLAERGVLATTPAPDGRTLVEGASLEGEVARRRAELEATLAREREDRTAARMAILARIVEAAKLAVPAHVQGTPEAPGCAADLVAGACACIDAICGAFSLTPEALLSPDRAPAAVEARVYLYGLLLLERFTLAQIGRIAQRDHSTIHHAWCRLESWKACDPASGSPLHPAKLAEWERLRADLVVPLTTAPADTRLALATPPPPPAPIVARALDRGLARIKRTGCPERDAVLAYLVTTLIPTPEGQRRAHQQTAAALAGLAALARDPVLRAATLDAVLAARCGVRGGDHLGSRANPWEATIYRHAAHLGYRVVRTREVA